MTAGTRAEQEWMDLVADLMTEPSDVLPDERIAVTLCETFGLAACSYNDMAPGRWGLLRLWSSERHPDDLYDEVTQWRVGRAPEEHPILRFYLHTGRRVPMQTADVPERIAGPTRVGGWADVSRAAGIGHQLSLPLRLGAGTHRAFVLGRAERFGSQELRLGQLLWRLLTGLDRQTGVLGRVRPGADVAADLRLTPRELAVLGLLVEGLTAAAIGRRLVIAERTVHKHLGHVYAKLGVADRLSAVLRAQDTGLIAG